jgi:glycosyltransferase involved in cell wall biosynthesis
VIASDVGGLPEYVTAGHTGLIVPPGDAQALAAAIEQVIGDPPFAEQLSRNITDAALHQLGWRHTVESLLGTYRDALKRRDRHAP